MTTWIQLVDDILTTQCTHIVNPVNLQGKMGKGLALQMAQRFPHHETLYKEAVEDGELRTDKVVVVPSDTNHPPEYKIVLLATKVRWFDPSKIFWVRKGLISLRETIKNQGIESIAIPALGCGNGGLSWNDVEPLIRRELDGLDCRVELYPPQ